MPRRRNTAGLRTYHWHIRYTNGWGYMGQVQAKDEPSAMRKAIAAIRKSTGHRYDDKPIKDFKVTPA